MAVITTAFEGPFELVDIRTETDERRRSLTPPRWLRRLLGPLAIFGLWSAVSYGGLVSTHILASPSQVVQAGWHLATAEDLAGNLWASIQRVVKGLGLGILIGVTLALLAGLFRWGEDLVDSLMQLFHSLPVIALIPLLIVWLGIDETPKVTVIALGTAFPIYLNTYSAIRNVDRRLVETGTAFGLGRLALIRHVLAPAAVPGFLVGLRMSMTTSLLVLIFVEQLNAVKGLGVLMNSAETTFNTGVIIFILVLYALYGLLTVSFVRFLERILVPWRRGFQGQ